MRSFRDGILQDDIGIHKKGFHLQKLITKRVEVLWISGCQLIGCCSQLLLIGFPPIVKEVEAVSQCVISFSSAAKLLHEVVDNHQVG
jgi:hypothetical protein